MTIILIVGGVIGYLIGNMVAKKEGFTSMDTMTGSPIIDDLPNVRGIAPQQNPDFKPPYQDDDTPSPEFEVLGDDLDMLETANHGLNQNLVLPADLGPSHEEWTEDQQML